MAAFTGVSMLAADWMMDCQFDEGEIEVVQLGGFFPPPPPFFLKAPEALH